MKPTLKTYWLCQLAGWTGFVLIEVSNYTFFIAKTFIPALVLTFSLQAVAGLLLMHGYRWYLHRTRYQWRASSGIWLKALADTLVLACLQTVLADLMYTIVGGISFLKQLELIDFVGSVYNWMRYIGVWVIIYYMYQLLKSSSEAEKALLTAESNSRNAELELLKAQLNPHFLFNALNSIKALVTIDPEKSRTAIVQLSEILRFTLQYNREQLIPLEQELAETTKYLALEQLRYGNRLVFHVNRHIPTADWVVPPAMLLTLAENAVKHGIGQLENGGHIDIVVAAEGPWLCITMRNSGQYQPQGHVGLGLKQIRTRLEALYQDRASLHIHNQAGSVEARLKIPQL
ncbi:MAG: histidine kinase [Chitinophagaceae bacterium]|nr:histidine kinase [Chitinophagaceae bacterium]